MVQTIQKSVNKGNSKDKGQETVTSNPPVAPTSNDPTVSNMVPSVTETPNTNGESSVTTATVPSAKTGEKVVKVPLSKYKEEVKFNMSEYLRSLIEKDNGITTEDALIALENDHPRLVVKKEAFGVVLSNLKSKERNKNNPSGTGGKGSSEVTLEDVVKAKELVKSNGGLDHLLAALESYRAFKVLTDALGGEEKTVKILEMMDALRKE